MAPERVRGGVVGPAVNVFALAGVLVFALTGQPPFGDGDALPLLYRIMNQEPRLDTVPPDLRPLLERCLAKHPDARPSTRDLADELPGRSVTAEPEA